MLWFKLCFPAAMIVAPLVFVCFTPTRMFQPEQAARHRRRFTALVAVTAVALGMFAGAWFAFPPLAPFSWVLFFPLWFGLAMPTIAARHPDLTSSHPHGVRRRGASMMTRNAERYVPGWFWILPALIVVAAFAAILLRPLGEDFDAPAQWRMLLALALQIVCGSALLIVPLVVLPAISREPEPLDGSGSPALSKAYAELRCFKGRSMAWCLGLGMTALTALINVSLAWTSADSARTGLFLAIVGGVGGTLIGIAGAVVGTLASVRRARINALLRELDSPPANAPRHA